MQNIRPRFFALLLAFLVTLSLTTAAFAQGEEGTVAGTITDTTGAVIPGATVTIANPVSGYTHTTTADASGQFRFFNLPLHTYELSVKMHGFQSASRSVQVSSSLVVNVTVPLQIAAANQTINVEAPVDLVETDSTAHTDIDRSTIDHLPVESASSQLSSIITLSSPGVSADSNGMMHGLGDHAENSFNIDGQPITDQQSKVFSNQVPAAAVQSLEVIEGAPPAEYGDKTSLVIKATTRSGQGVTKPTGSVAMDYGSFGSTNLSFDLAYGGAKWGNFIAANGLNTGRFLDAPEFAVMHDRGNEENVFDRVDRQFTQKDTLQLNLQYTRSWFQTPNTFDQQFITLDPAFVATQYGINTGPTDQRSQIQTIDIAPTYTRTINDQSVLNVGSFVRRDSYNYYPSNNPLNDLGPANLQQESVAQQRSLTNTGVHADLTYAQGIHNAKAGILYEQTFLREHDQIGLVAPTLNSPCVDANGNPVPGFNDPSQCANAGDTANPAYNTTLAPYDFTRGGNYYAWFGHTDVKQLAMYVEDQITAGNWLVNAGIRGDIYNGLAIQREIEPRFGVSYNVKKTGTVLRASYARTQETPFNENLVLSSQGCYDSVINAVFSTIGSCIPAAFNPGFRNEFHVGFEQAVGRHFVLNAEYIWKYTHNGYDFSVLGATPITFPIEWHNSKIPGFAISGTLTQVKGFSATVNMSSVAARFFNPQIGGLGATPGAAGGYPFRIDHDERFNQTTHLEYAMPFRKSLYYSFNWRYDSGLVAGSVPCYNVTDPNSACGGTSILINGQPGIDLSGLTYDQQFQAGLICNGVAATASTGFSQCLASELTSKLVNIPAAGTENDDRNPQRVQPRNLFDMALGDDDILHFGAQSRYKFGARVTAINVTNKYALYNFLSTFSGTHYVTPRALTAEVNFHF